MGDQDKEKNVEDPEVVQKVCDGSWLHQTERTVHAIAPRLCRFLSPIRLLLLVLSDLFLFFLFTHEGLCWFSPRDTSLDLAIHNRTISLDMGRLSGWFESHHGLGGWDKRLDMSQKARVAKGHELPRVVS